MLIVDLLVCFAVESVSRSMKLRVTCAVHLALQFWRRIYFGGAGFVSELVVPYLRRHPPLHIELRMPQHLPIHFDLMIQILLVQYALPLAELLQKLHRSGRTLDLDRSISYELLFLYFFF